MSKHTDPTAVVAAGHVQTMNLEVDIRWCPVYHHYGERQGEELIHLSFSAGRVHRRRLIGTRFAYGCHFGQLSGRPPGPGFDLEVLVCVSPMQ